MLNAFGLFKRLGGGLLAKLSVGGGGFTPPDPPAADKLLISGTVSDSLLISGTASDALLISNG